MVAFISTRKRKAKWTHLSRHSAFSRATKRTPRKALDSPCAARGMPGGGTGGPHINFPEGGTPAERLDLAFRKVLTVPKAELLKEEEKEKAGAREEARGQKGALMISASTARTTADI